MARVMMLVSDAGETLAETRTTSRAVSQTRNESDREYERKLRNQALVSGSVRLRRQAPTLLSWGA